MGLGCGGGAAQLSRAGREDQRLRVISHHYIMKYFLICGSTEERVCVCRVCAYMETSPSLPQCGDISQSQSKLGGCFAFSAAVPAGTRPAQTGPFSIPSWRGEGLTRPNPSPTV